METLRMIESGYSTSKEKFGSGGHWNRTERSLKFVVC